MEKTAILVPLDGSTVAEGALPYAEALAAAFRSQLRLLIALNPDYLGTTSAALGVDPRLERSVWQDTSERYLSRTAAPLHARGLSVDTVVALGDPVGEILRAEESATLVVMATHGRGAVQRWIIGSVADKVMRLGTRPVLLVRAPEQAKTIREVKIKRLLVPLDGSPLAEEALPEALKLAQATGASVSLVRVQPWLSAMLYADGENSGYASDVAAWETDVEEAAQQYLAEVKQRLPAAIHPEAVVLRGDASLMLDEYAKQHDIDLVVMSTHGRSGLRRAVLGSVAERLVRAGLPAILVRPSAKAAETSDAQQAVAGGTDQPSAQRSPTDDASQR